MIKYLLLCVVLISGGCASAGLNASCGHLVANGSYATAQANGDGFACHEGCFGFNCPTPDYGKLNALATAYVNASNAVTTTVPITVSVVPTSK